MITISWTQQGRQCTYQHNTEVRSHNHYCRGKAINTITDSECVSIALVTQHAKCMHHITLPSVACLALWYFSTLSHKWHNFQNKVTEYKICVLISSTTSVWNISHSENYSARYYHKYTWVFMWSTCYSSDINDTWFFLTDLLKILRY